MSMTTLFRSRTSAPIRARGEFYFHQRRVGRIRVAGDEIEATVRGSGSRAYDVKVVRHRERIEGICSCPYFTAGSGICKHLWAVFIELDRRGIRSADWAPRARDGEKRALPNSPPHAEVEDDDELDDDDEPVSRRATPPVGRKDLESFGRTDWRDVLHSGDSGSEYPEASRSRFRDGEVIYCIAPPKEVASADVMFAIRFRGKRAVGSGWKRARPLALPWSALALLPDRRDRELLQLLGGASTAQSMSGSYYGARYAVPEFVQAAPALAAQVLALAAPTGRLFLESDGPDFPPEKALGWDDGPTIETGFAIEPAANGWSVAARPWRGDRPLRFENAMLLPCGFVLAAGRLARIDFGESAGVFARLLAGGPAQVPAAEGLAAAAALLALPGPPRIDLPAELQFEAVTALPRPSIFLAQRPAALPRRPPLGPPARRSTLAAEVGFDYDGVMVGIDSSEPVFDLARRRCIARDPEREAAALRDALEVGLRSPPARQWHGPRDAAIFVVAAADLPRLVDRLTATGWLVRAEGALYRQPGSIRVEVKSSVDWFDLNGVVEYGETQASIAAVLAALRERRRYVTLDDGSQGLLPEEWLAKLGLIADLGQAQAGGMRFRRAQAPLLGEALEAVPEVRTDAAFDAARRRLAGFAGIAPVDPPAAFRGELREYQREGLAWLRFLAEIGIGGCLADDMGLGKTVQVLALLAGRREASKPSLVVAPRSVVHNWIAEAERFVPGLRVVEHTGTSRWQASAPFAEADLVITTYGTLRRDVTRLAATEFDWLVLDEAQAIKNAGSQSAKAARRLRGRHRLALSGTPIENHLGELWSLFEFLEPGLLGRSSLFDAASRQEDDAARRLLARALRPFLLRRTKEQVAQDLPERTEQTLSVELEAPQRRLYDSLRDHYRASIHHKIEHGGMNRAHLHVLEALLRLRQAACHPGLVDPTRKDEAAAKLEALLPMLEEIVAEGHKALVFSQFTSLLDLVEARLGHLPFERLDGKTRNRGAVVERFQSTAGGGIFLISLKAGGLGLNLTAAAYVFLLDPWWNPAVEAQAIDRTHRIGQSRNVFAYRLVAKDTVEEKILELQSRKRALADAILTQDGATLRSLSREDVEMLLE